MRVHGRALGVAAAAALFAAIFALRLAFGDADQTLGLTYALPVAVAAIFVGRTAGLVAAVVGLGLWAGQRAIHGADIEVAQAVTRGVTLGLLGGLVGHYVERGTRAQRQLQDAEGGYRDLLERVPAIVYTAEYGPEGRWSYVSPRIESILGYSVTEWTANADSWYSRLHPDDRDQALAAEERSKATGEPLDSEYRMIARDGKTLWFRDEASVVYDQHGQPAMLQGVMLDITSRKRAENELELRYAVQRKLAEAASLNEGLHDALKTAAEPFGWKVAAFWTVDDHENALRLTDMWCADDISGDAFKSASRGLRLAREEGLPGRAWASGEPVWISDVLTESNFPRKEAAEACGLRAAIAYPAIGRGQTLGVLEFFAREPRDPDPEMLSHLPSVSAQLADFVATSAAIEEHRGRFQAVLDNAPALVYAKDPHGRYLFVNRRFEAVVAMSSDAIVGKTDDDLGVAGVAALTEDDAHAFENEQQLEIEAQVILPDGPRTFLSVKFPLRDAAGSVYAVCGISTDVTELKRAQQELHERAELERAHRAKSAFLSRVSHELRTPLNAILGFGQVLEVDSLSDRQRNSVQQIMKGGRHLLELVNDLLELSRIESGELRVSLAPVDIARAVNDIVLMVEPLAGERSVTIFHDIDPATPIALADEQRFRQVVLNLVSNAIKYNREGGRVDIVVHPATNGRIAMRIADTGHGIATHDLERLFSPFERLGAEQTGVEGTGLGLALSKLMVEAMDGSLDVTSVPGEGSTFTVEVPAAPVLPPVDRSLARVGR
jgi:PAS domain S-box-containing protein